MTDREEHGIWQRALFGREILDYDEVMRIFGEPVAPLARWDAAHSPEEPNA